MDWVALHFDPTDQLRLDLESVSVRSEEIKRGEVACPKHQVDPHRLKPVYLALCGNRRRRRAEERTAQARHGCD